MLGLLTKDLCLLKQRKRFFILIAILGIVFSFNAEAEFVVGYLTILCTLFVNSTLIYDEYDNCYPFLMSLPVTAKSYVLEKFLYGIILDLASFTFSLLIFFGVSVYQNQCSNWSSLLLSLISWLPFPLIFLSILLPITMKFGSEKSRVITLLIGGVCVAIYFLTTYLVDVFHLVIPKAFITFLNTSAESQCLNIWIAAILLMLLSSFISIHIMKHKEY